MIRSLGLSATWACPVPTRPRQRHPNRSFQPNRPSHPVSKWLILPTLDGSDVAPNMLQILIGTRAVGPETAGQIACRMLCLPRWVKSAQGAIWLAEGVRALLRLTAIKAQSALAAPKRHSIKQPLDDRIQRRFGIGGADVLGIATWALRHPWQPARSRPLDNEIQNSVSSRLSKVRDRASKDGVLVNSNVSHGWHACHTLGSADA